MVFLIPLRNYRSTRFVIYNRDIEKTYAGRADKVRIAMNTMPSQQNIPDLVQLKLEAFDRLQPEFEASFQFLQDAHRHKRFPAFPVADVVRYLHARWICELKGRLLGVAKTVKEYDGERCLEAFCAMIDSDMKEGARLWKIPNVHGCWLPRGSARSPSSAC